MSGKEYNQRNKKIISAKEMKPNPCKGKKCQNDEELLTLPERSSRSLSHPSPPLLYDRSLSITRAKFNDLKALVDKAVIPHNYKNEYLQMSPSDQLCDVLPETDEEDGDVHEEDFLSIPSSSGTKRKRRKS